MFRPTGRFIVWKMMQNLISHHSIHAFIRKWQYVYARLMKINTSGFFFRNHFLLCLGQHSGIQVNCFYTLDLVNHCRRK